jgi:methylmalonyl-CoA mutase N-terminal domain/subunit
MLFNKNRLAKIQAIRRRWETGALKKALQRFGIEKSPSEYFTPLDIENHDFLEKVGFPGEYPFTAGEYPTLVPGGGPQRGGGSLAVGGGLVRAGRYSGYGSSEDLRDYYRYMQSIGQRTGPNVAFDLPTQCGLDSDHAMAQGEVGRTGVAINTLRDFEVIYEAFTGDMDLDKIASNFTINAPANIIMAIYVALAEERGIAPDRLRFTIQNDILKEYIARGTQIFPLLPSMRMTRDSFAYSVKNLPLAHPISICGYHIREAGASRTQTLAWTLGNIVAYIDLGLQAGLDIDVLAPRLSFLNWSGSLEIFHEVALRRAFRRMYASLLRDRYSAKNPRSWMIPEAGGGYAGNYSFTAQRPLNNLARTVVGGIIGGLAGDIPSCEPPYDEPLGLGWSMEAQQLTEDAARILTYETDLCQVRDPLAGSYFIEALTDKIEEEAWQSIKVIEDAGGMVAAIKSGYIRGELMRSIYQTQKEIESGEKVIVGVNKFIGEHEFEVTTQRTMEHPYDPKRRADAEARQIANLMKVKRERDNEQVSIALDRLGEAARDENTNLVYPILEAVKTYASVGEICDVLREVFGTYESEVQY